MSTLPNQAHGRKLAVQSKLGRQRLAQLNNSNVHWLCAQSTVDCGFLLKVSERYLCNPLAPIK